MSSLLLAACVIAPLAYFATIMLPLVWCNNPKIAVTVQVIGAIITLTLWISIHHFACTFYPEWGYAMMAVNAFLGLMALMALALVGATSDITG